MFQLTVIKVFVLVKLRHGEVYVAYLIDSWAKLFKES